MLEVVDHYVNGMYAIFGLIHAFRFDSRKRTVHDVQFELGRRMQTSAANRVTPNQEITPDVVIQPNENQGVIGEATTGLTTEDEYWRDKLEQILKYDDDLRGWWTKTEHIDIHDIVVLVQLTRATRLSDLIDKTSKEAPERNTFRRKIAVVGFERSSGALRQYMTFIKLYGDLTDLQVSRSLREGIKIAYEYLIFGQGYKDKKFVDSKPPLPYLLQILWDDLLGAYADTFSYNRALNCTPVTVSVDKVTADLQQFYGFPSRGARGPEIPKSSWIREALEALVHFKLAERDGDGYMILYKRSRVDSMKRFGNLCFKMEQKKAKSTPDAGQGILNLRP
jgi:hypothetical protein